MDIIIPEDSVRRFNFEGACVYLFIPRDKKLSNNQTLLKYTIMVTHHT